MNTPPPLSVLLSVRNGMPYVPATIASILAQTHSDFEFIIVDNCSTDCTREHLAEMERKDARVRVLLNERDLGHSGGLNRGLAECRAEWVARMDADDIALPERLARQLAFVNENPRAGVVSCLAHYIDPAGRRVGKTYHDLKSAADFERYMKSNEMIGVLHPGALLDRELILRLGGYREPFGGCNDIDLWARVAESGRLILVQQEYLLEYRIHPNQTTARFMENRLRYEWTRACAQARRAGEREPDWDAFLRNWTAAPLWRRVNRARKARAKYFYRQGGMEFVCGRRMAAALNFAGAMVLQPSYALHRFIGQRPVKS